MGKINIWVLRPNPQGKNMSQIFLEKNIVAIGWSDLPDLSKMDKEQIREEIETNYSADVSSRKIGLHVGMIDRFANKMKKGDVLVVPDGSKLHVAQINGNYEYKKEMGISHCRKVNWLKKNVARKQAPEELQKGLRSMLALYSLNKNRDSILEWIRKITPEENLGTINPLPTKFEEAIIIEILLEHGESPPPFPSILNLAKKQIPESVQKRAQEITEKVKVWSGNGTWKGQELVVGSEDHPIISYSTEIMEMIKESTLEKEIENEKEKIYNDGKRRLKNALGKAKKGDYKPLKKVVSALKEKDKLVEGISTKIIEELKLEVNKEEQKKLAKIEFVTSVEELAKLRNLDPKEIIDDYFNEGRGV